MAQNEFLLMRLYNAAIPQRTTLTATDVRCDQVTMDLLNDHHSWLLAKCFPISVVGDGNCLFRAISLLVYGNECHHLHLRLLSAIEVIMNRELYDSSSSHYYAPFAADPFLLVSPYNILVRDICKLNTYCDMLSILAASTVTCRPIQTLWPRFPDEEGNIPTTISPLQKLVVGRGVVTAARPITIHWTASVYKRGERLVINHFVPMFERPLPPPMQSTRVMDSTDNSHEVIKNGELVELCPIPMTRCVDHDDGNDDDEGLDQNQLAVPAFVPNCEVHREFLSTRQCLDLLSEPTHVFRRIPVGNKSNVAFVVRRMENATGKQLFWDDCGVWAEGNTLKVYLSRVDLKELRFRDGVYYLRKKVERKLQYILCDPQPSQDDVIVMNRYYAKLKRDVRYERRITTVSSVSGIVLYEYMGMYPDNISVHGKATQNFRQYVRAQPQTIKNRRIGVKYKIDAKGNFYTINVR